MPSDSNRVWTAIASGVLAATFTGATVTPPPVLDRGYREMYNLNFAGAHQAFASWKESHPSDAMGPVSNAAAYLFSELDRLHVLQTEFFTEDEAFVDRQRKLAPDPEAKRNFENELNRARSLAAAALAGNSNDENAMLAELLCAGLHSDYLFLIEKRNMAAFSEAKDARRAAQRLLMACPDCYDAYLAGGIENYLLSLKAAPVRWAIRLGGGQTDRRTGIKLLRITAEKGSYLRPYARLLLAVAALRDKDVPSARENLASLAAEFPNNRLYREELAKLK